MQSDKAKLTERRCKPCEGGVKPLTMEQIGELMPALHADWVLDDAGKKISRDLRFVGFNRTIAFVNAIAWVASTEGHHPELRVGYGYCDVTYHTHAIGGLSENDFICAAKIDRIAVDA